MGNGISEGFQDGKEIPAICGICPGGCGVKALVSGGKLVRVKPLNGHPRGMVCVRGAYGAEIVHSPDRLTKPLKRTGPKGKGEFSEISWDVALAEIAESLLKVKNKYGPQSLMIYSGRGGFDKPLRETFGVRGDGLSNNILFPLGSPNAASCASICKTSHGRLAPIPTYGFTDTATEPDIDHARLVVVWGTNPVTDSPPTVLRKILKAWQRGAEVYVIDQFRSTMAQKANRWVGIRPGTDGALALSMIHVVVKEGLYDQDFVEKWTVGFPELIPYVEQFPPERAEEITGVPSDEIRELARKIAAKEATLCMYSGLEFTNSGVQNIRAVLILWAITGNLDAPGGLLFNPDQDKKMTRPEVNPPAGILPLGADKYPLFYELTGAAHILELPRAVLEDDPYPVRSLIIQGGSILTSCPQPDIWRKSFTALDLLVVVDRFLTGDAQFADYVLPATTYYENAGYWRYRGYVQLRQPVVNPVGEARNDLFIFAGLAQRLGYGHLYPQTEDELLNWAFADQPQVLEELKHNPAGVKLPVRERQYRQYELGLLRKDGQPGFPTPSGKVEITSGLLAKYGYEPLPVYSEPLEGPLINPEMAKQYPLVLSTGARIQSTFRSQHLNIPGLLKLQPEPQVLIHPRDAAERAIEDGDPVILSTVRGQAPFYARVTDDMRPGVVEVNSGGGSTLHPKEWQEGNANLLTDLNNRDPISGFPVFKALLCQVAKNINDSSDRQ